MPCEVIPFPVAVKTISKEMPILARHHIVIEVGKSRYDVDVMGFVTPLQPAMAEGGRSARYILTGSGTEREPAVVVPILEWSQSPGRGWRAVLKLEGSKQKWEEYWKQLGIVIPSPGAATDNKGKISLALGRQQSDESSCATSAKEVNMTNAETPETAPQEGAPVAKATTKRAGAARKSSRAKAASKKRKGPPLQPRTSVPIARTRTGAKPKKETTTSAQKPRPESKGAQILELIGRAKGATLAELMQATSWQAHSVRGFLSTAAKKHRFKIASARNATGERTYKVDR
jgi:hypothetical protein